MPAIDTATAKRLAEKLHRVNSYVVNTKRASLIGSTTSNEMAIASSLLKDVIGTLMDLPGQTDYYGNRTER